MIVDHFDRQGVARFYAGEPIAAELQLLDATGAVQDLTGREFALTLFGADRAVVESVLGTFTDDGAIAFRLDGSVSNTLFGRTDLRWEVAEIVADGRDVQLGGQLVILAAPASVAPAPAASVGPPVTRFVRQLLTQQPRLVIQQRGGVGPMPDLSTILERLATLEPPFADLSLVTNSSLTSILLGDF